jgi:sigma-E factor negative regulatory protein RseA
MVAEKTIVHDRDYMNKQNEQLKEQISSLVDGELDANEVDTLLSALRVGENIEQWELYHQIGDLLRSDDLAVTMSSDFSARMEAKLAAEPNHFNPEQKKSRLITRKNAYIAVAAALLLTILSPQFAGHDGAEVDAPYFTGHFLADNGAVQGGASVSMTTSRKSNAPQNQPKMLRDPSIDSYLAAHQRYSKSMYSTVEYETGPINQEVEK